MTFHAELLLYQNTILRSLSLCLNLKPTLLYHLILSEKLEIQKTVEKINCLFLCL